jgi:hypothetical protein
MPPEEVRRMNSPIKIPFWDGKTIVTLFLTLSTPVLWYLGFKDAEFAQYSLQLKSAFFFALVGSATMWWYHVWKRAYLKDLEQEAGRKAAEREARPKRKPFVPKENEHL